MRIGNTDRRTFLKVSGAAGATAMGALAGCTGDGNGSGSNGGSSPSGGDNSSGGTVTESELTSVTVGFSHYPVIPHGLPLTVGIEQGFFENNGIKIDDVVSTGGGGGGVRTITTGDIQIGMNPPNATAKAFRQGAPLYIVGMATAVPDIDYQTRADSDIETIQDVETIAVTDPASSGEANAVLSIEAADGISLDDIEFQYTGGLGEVISAVTEGIADVGLNTNPTSTKMLEAGDTRRVWHTRDYVQNYTEDILSMGPVFLENQPEVARSFLQGWIDSSEFIRNNVEETGRMWADAAGHDEELAIAGLKDTEPENFFQIEVKEEFVNNLESVLRFDGTLSEGESLDRQALIHDQYLPDKHQSDWL